MPILLIGLLLLLLGIFLPGLHILFIIGLIGLILGAVVMVAGGGGPFRRFWP